LRTATESWSDCPAARDSWALIQILEVLRRRAPIKFSLVAVNVNSGYERFRHDLVTDACAARGWECRVEHTTIGAIMDDILDDGDTPCSLCARLRRGVLYRVASEVGATKIALGHHLDDFVETALLNLFFQGRPQGHAGPARVRLQETHRDSAAGVRHGSRGTKLHPGSGLPVIGCCCPACGDLSLKRQRMKRLIADLELEHPDIKNSMMKALSNVVPSHLLDRRLQPNLELARR
jgi:tRNA 2-thiocytidine biosynthesis protein TtcA